VYIGFRACVPVKLKKKIAVMKFYRAKLMMLNISYAFLYTKCTCNSVASIQNTKIVLNVWNSLLCMYVRVCWMCVCNCSPVERKQLFIVLLHYVRENSFPKRCYVYDRTIKFANSSREKCHIPNCWKPPWSPSKYSPWEAMHRCQRLVHPSKQFCNWFCGMAFRAAVVLLLMSSM
jgi:hypothetical protein